MGVPASKITRKIELHPADQTSVFVIVHHFYGITRLSNHQIPIRIIEGFSGLLILVVVFPP